MPLVNGGGGGGGVTGVALSSILKLYDCRGQIGAGNTTFILPEPYVEGTLQVYWNATLQNGTLGYITDFNFADGKFTVADPPVTGDSMVAVYIKNG